MTTKLGIIAGKGTLPEELAQACEAAGRLYFILAIESETDPAFLESRPHAWVRLAAVGKALKILRQEGVREVVFAGGIARPAFSTLIPDLAGAKLMARILKANHGGGGDDALLSTLVAFMEEEGFPVVGADTVLGGGKPSQGALGRLAPSEEDMKDITLGLKAAHALGALDIGQAVIVQQGVVLGVEAKEGTDALIARCAALKLEPKGGVLVKACKPQQETRVDLPTIGPHTVRNIAAIGLSGVAFEAGATMIVNREEMVALADELGVFVHGA